MFKRIIFTMVICPLGVSASVLSNQESQHLIVDRNTVLADPDCPYPSSGTGGGC